MALNINGTTGISGVDGSVSAPAVTGTDSNTGITFPSADTIKFSTGGVERMSITNSGVTGAGGKFASYAIIADQKSANTLAGTFTSGAWRTRDLNTEVADADGIVSISSNQFILQAGTYLLIARAPAYHVSRHQLRLQNITDSSSVEYGMGQYTYTSDDVQTFDILITRFTISGAKTFELQHRCESSHSNDGLGVSQGGTWTIPNEQYAVIEIYKES